MESKSSMKTYTDSEDYVIKRNGKKEKMSFDKILKRLKNLGKNTLKVNYTNLVQKIIDRLYNNIATTVIDELTAQQCASLCTTHPDYQTLAARILVSNHHKNTSSSFKTVIKTLYKFKDIHGVHTPIVSKEIFDLSSKYSKKIEETIDYNRDFLIDYFGFKTLERAYLMKVNGSIVERPQHMWMRVSIGIHGDNIEKIVETYNLMSLKYFTHATPTLFNAGTNRPQLSSCYLLAMENDSIKGIYNTLGDCAAISKWAGGIGLHIHNVRASGSHIRGTNGTSNGIVPMLRVFNNTARYVDQCVLPETTIYTTEGPKQIQNCVANKTQIFTTNGPEKINNVLEHAYDGEALSINTLHSYKPLVITPEHPVYTLRHQKKGLNYNLIKKRLQNNIISPEWVDAKDLTLDDMLIYTIPQYEKDMHNITEDDCYMYGLLLGDGHMSNSSTYNYISLHSKNKKDVANFVKNYLTTRCVRYFEDNENNTTRIRWNKTLILPFRYNTLYNEYKVKRVHSNWLNLPIEKAKNIVKGLLKSDGCIHKELTFDSTSENLVESMRYILLRMGVPTSGYIRDRVGQKHTSKYGDVIENKKISFCLRIPKVKEITNLLNIEKGRFHKYFTYNNMIFTRISSIEKSTYNGTLYDLQMNKTHDYMIHNGTVHNGGGKRNGSFAIYLAPWHGDIFEFLEMKKNHGDEEARARDLFYALWIPDLFMERIKTNDKWSLMCPDVCKGLSDVHGDDFKNLYEKYENEGKFIKQINARDLWFKILDSQIETGTPYILYSDAANRKSNQKNLGTIKSSNLCCEIIEYSNDKETAVCNLASVNLSSFVCKSKFNFDNKSLNIYTKNDCVYCKLAKNLLKEHNIDYNEIRMEKESFKKYFYETYEKDVGTYPQIECDSNYIGTFDDLSDMLSPTYDFDKLHSVVKVMTENLNKVIDVNFYPTEKTLRSNLLHRPIGIGVQGLANCFALMDIPFHSNEAKELNKLIFETIYHAALEKSNEIAVKRKDDLIALYHSWVNKEWSFTCEFDATIDEPHCRSYKTSFKNIQKILDDVKPIYAEMKNFKNLSTIGSYSSFKGSPISDGTMQFDFWEVNPIKYDFKSLKKSIIETGIRNSLLVAPMPTASTSQILGNNECFEPFTSNIYLRRTIAGEFIVINKHLIDELIAIELWNDDIKNHIIANDGSIQNIKGIPSFIKEKYKTVWEIPMKHILDMSADRGAFICQSQSNNLWMKNPDYKKLTAMHLYSHKLGLKTGIYYLRTQAKSAPQQFTIDPTKKSTNNSNEPCEMCSA